MVAKIKNFCKFENILQNEKTNFNKPIGKPITNFKSAEESVKIISLEMTQNYVIKLMIIRPN